MTTTPVPYILGLDLSLTSTGWAKLHADGSWVTGLIKTKAHATTLPEHQDVAYRLRDIIVAVGWLADPEAGCAYVGYEDLALRSMGGPSAVGQLGRVHGAVGVHLLNCGYLHTVPVNVSTVKKLATGSGLAGKPEVFAEAIKRLGYQGKSMDETDAMWVAVAAALHRGFPVPVQLPKAHLVAIDAMTI